MGRHLPLGPSASDDQVLLSRKPGLLWRVGLAREPCRSRVTSEAQLVYLFTKRQHLSQERSPPGEPAPARAIFVGEVCTVTSVRAMLSFPHGPCLFSSLHLLPFSVFLKGRKFSESLVLLHLLSHTQLFSLQLPRVTAGLPPQRQSYEFISLPQFALLAMKRNPPSRKNVTSP